MIRGNVRKRGLRPVPEISGDRAGFVAANQIEYRRPSPGFRSKAPRTQLLCQDKSHDTTFFI